MEDQEFDPGSLNPKFTFLNFCASKERNVGNSSLLITFYAKHFTFSISINPQKNPMWKIKLITPIIDKKTKAKES